MRGARGLGASLIAVCLVGSFLVGCGRGGSEDPPIILNSGATALSFTSMTANRGISTGGTSVTITGTGFSGTTTVLLNTQAMTGVTVVSSTSITATTPALAALENPSATLTINSGGQSTIRTQAFGYIIQLENTTVGTPSAAAGDNLGGIEAEVGVASGFFFNGVAVVVANFDVTNGPDFAVGIPNRDQGANTNAGQVDVFFCDSSGQFTTGRANLIAATPVTNANFGFSLAAGDANGDTVPDLVIGAPNDDSQGTNDAGEAFILPSNGAAQTFGTEIPLTNPSPLTEGRFGYAVAIGNFDGAGGEEILVGEPNDNLNGINADSGAIHLFSVASGFINTLVVGVLSPDGFGASLVTGDFDGDANVDGGFSRPGHDPAGGVSREGDAGLAVSTGTVTNSFFTTVNALPAAVPQTDSFFGIAMATGNFDGANNDDLLVGQPQATSGGLIFAGLANALFNDGTGLNFNNQVNIFEPTAETVAEFGKAVAVGDLDGDGDDDLVIASPVSSVNALFGAGEVHIILSNGSAQTFTFSETLTEPTPEANAQFGFSVATGDFNADGLDDIVITAPGASAVAGGGTISQGGQVFVFYSPR